MHCFVQDYVTAAYAIVYSFLLCNSLFIRNVIYFCKMHLLAILWHISSRESTGLLSSFRFYCIQTMVWICRIQTTTATATTSYSPCSKMTFRARKIRSDSIMISSYAHIECRMPTIKHISLSCYIINVIYWNMILTLRDVRNVML
jgi:hypothetical protein